MCKLVPQICLGLYGAQTGVIHIYAFMECKLVPHICLNGVQTGASNMPRPIWCANWCHTYMPSWCKCKLVTKHMPTLWASWYLTNDCVKTGTSFLHNVQTGTPNIPAGTSQISTGCANWLLTYVNKMCKLVKNDKA